MSERIYGWLLRLYPTRFRREYGEAMRQVFRDRMITENPLALWAEVLSDLMVSVPREHWRPRQSAKPTAGFTLSEKALNQLAKRSHHGPSLSVAIVIFSAAATIGILGNAPPWPLFSIFSALLVLRLTMTTMSRARNRQHWKGFEVILEADRLLVKQAGIASIFLKADIKLMELPGFGLYIQPDADRPAFLPLVLTGYQEIRETLLTWAPIETEPSHSSRHIRFMRFLRLDFFATVYALGLLVRSPYFLFPIACLAATALLFWLRMMVRHEAPSKWRLLPVSLLIPLAINVIFTLRR